MLGGHFESANWSDLAVIFDGEDDILKSIQFNQFFWWNLNFFLFTDITIKFFLISILIISSVVSWWLSLSLFSLSWLLELSLWLSKEVTLISVNMLLVLIIQIWHLLEEEVVAECPVELLHWELETVLISDGNCNIVVVLDACNKKLQIAMWYLPVTLPQKRSSSQFMSVCSL